MTTAERTVASVPARYRPNHADTAIAALKKTNGIRSRTMSWIDQRSSSATATLAAATSKQTGHDRTGGSRLAPSRESGSRDSGGKTIGGDDPLFRRPNPGTLSKTNAGASIAVRGANERCLQTIHSRRPDERQREAGPSPRQRTNPFDDRSAAPYNRAVRAGLFRLMSAWLSVRVPPVPRALTAPARRNASERALRSMDEWNSCRWATRSGFRAADCRDDTRSRRLHSIDSGSLRRREFPRPE
jgi:hypothetical protein